MTQQPGVYKITCTITNKLYIGSSTNITTRWKTHLRQLKAGKHKNFSLQQDFTRYGESYFTYTILELCPAHAVKEAEQMWLDKVLKLQSLSGKVVLYNYLTRTDGREALIERDERTKS